MAGRAPQNAYLQTQIKTASKEQLLMMLFDGAIRFSHQAKTAIENREIEQASNFCIKVQNIVNELMSSLDRELISADLYSNLMSLYSFVHKRMVQANIERDPSRIDEAVEILNRLRLVWKDAIDSVLAENNGRIPDRSEVTPPENSAAKLQLSSAGMNAIVAAPRRDQLTADEARPAALGKNTAHSVYSNTARPGPDSPLHAAASVPAGVAASQKFPMPTAPGPGAPSAPPGPPKPPAAGPVPPKPPVPGGPPAFVAPAAKPPAPPPPGPPPGPRPPAAPPPPAAGPAKPSPNGPTPPPGAPSGPRPRINLNKL